MSECDNPAGPARQSSPERPACDLLIVGGGIMGLWAAHFGRMRGLTVHLVDADDIGAGASGGLLGALMPHMPDRWSDKKQFQFDALVSLETDIAALEEATGLSAGYRRTGRLIPLPKPHLAEIALRHEQDALTVWNAPLRRFHWHVRDAGFAGSLVSDEESACGFVEDTLAARVNPRGLLALLSARLAGDQGFRLTRGIAVTALGRNGSATLSDGTHVAFGHAVIAAGHASSHLIEQQAGRFDRPLVTGVKGQAALLSARLPEDAPVIYRDGLYIVPHEGGMVAVGSTSEMEFDAPFTTDRKLDDLISTARALVPALGDATLVERWAGLRPRAIGRDPMVGRLPDAGRISVLTGGFKVSFGVAHVLGRALADMLADGHEQTGLPPSFDPARHLREAAPKV